MSKVVNLFRYEVYDFYWGSAVREQRTQKWIKIFLKPDAQELDVEDIPVIIHENGIEFANQNQT